jgi:hypothetical protein
MIDVLVDTEGVALKLVEQYGELTLVYVNEQIEAALKGGDWQRVKAWRGVGSEAENLLRQPPSRPGRLRR